MPLSLALSRSLSVPELPIPRTTALLELPIPRTTAQASKKTVESGNNMASDKMASLSLEDGRSIVNLLECPVCLDTMKPPIFQCQNGHSVCNKCKPEVLSCPTCRGALITTRNLLAEQLAYKVVYPCINTDRGCYEKVPLEDMKKHESACPYRLYECLVGKDSGCAWEGRRSEILRHMEEKHDKYMYRSDLCSFKYEEFNFNQECKFSCIFSSCGEIFWYRSQRDPQKRKLYEVVQYIGPKENACKYVYEHRLVSPSGDQKLTFSNVVRSDTDDLKTICEMRKCFIIEYDTLEMFAQNGKTFEYKIKMCTLR